MLSRRTGAAVHPGRHTPHTTHLWVQVADQMNSLQGTHGLSGIIGPTQQGEQGRAGVTWPWHYLMTLARKRTLQIWGRDSS